MSNNRYDNDKSTEEEFDGTSMLIPLDLEDDDDSAMIIPIDDDDVFEDSVPADKNSSKDNDFESSDEAALETYKKELSEALSEGMLDNRYRQCLKKLQKYAATVPQAKKDIKVLIQVYKSLHAGKRNKNQLMMKYSAILEEANEDGHGDYAFSSEMRQIDADKDFYPASVIADKKEMLKRAYDLLKKTDVSGGDSEKTGKMSGKSGKKGSENKNSAKKEESSSSGGKKSSLPIILILVIALVFAVAQITFYKHKSDSKDSVNVSQNDGKAEDNKMHRASPGSRMGGDASQFQPPAGNSRFGSHIQPGQMMPMSRRTMPYKTSEIDSEIKKTRELIKQEDYKGAQELMEPLLEQHPERYSARLLYATALFNLGDIEKAKEQLAMIKDNFLSRDDLKEKTALETKISLQGNNSSAEKTEKKPAEKSARQ